MVEKAGLSNRITVAEGSMFQPEFPDESFDIIWCEGILRYNNIRAKYY